MKREVVCPKCHSEQISSTKKGLTAKSVIKKGLLFGALTDANQIEITCLMCATKFFPGAGGIKITDNDGSVSFETKIIEEPQKSISDFYILAILLFIVIIVVILCNS